MICSKCKKLTKPDWVAYKDSKTLLCYDCTDEEDYAEPADIDVDDGAWLASAGMGTDEDYEYGY